MSSGGEPVATALAVCLSTRAMIMLERYSKAWGVTAPEALERITEEMAKLEQAEKKGYRHEV